jgi:hypothetical protein
MKRTLLTGLCAAACACGGPVAQTASGENAPRAPSPHPCILWDAPAGFGETSVDIFRDGKPVAGGRISHVARFVPAHPLDPGEYTWTARQTDDQEWRGTFVVTEPELEIRLRPGATASEIREALSKARGAASSRLVFEPGEYRLSPGAGRFLFEIGDTKGLIIEGTGAKLILTDVAGVARIRHSEHVTLRGFEVDYDAPIQTAARVETISRDGVMELALLPGYEPPETVPRFMEEQRGLFYEAEVPRMARDVPLLVYMQSPWEPLGDNRYRLQAARPREVANVRPGMIYLCAPRHGVVGFEIQDSDDITLADLTTFMLPGIGISSVFAEDLKLLRVKMLRRSDRLLGVQNGGTNLHNARVGPWVEGCRFENTGDDNNHVSALLFTPVEQPSPEEIVLSSNLPGVKRPSHSLHLRTGDWLAFFDRPTGSILAEARVASFEESRRRTRVVLDRSIPPIRTDAGVEGFPDRASTQVYNLDAVCGSFVFRHNEFVRGRRIGILAKGGPGLIEKNEFIELGGGGVEIFNAPYEGLEGESIWIRGNLFRGGGLVHRRQGPFAAVWTTIFDGRPPGLRHRDIRIEDNRIEDYPATAMELSDVDGLVVRGNRFTARGTAPAAPADATLVVLGNCSNVTLEDNVFADPRFGPEREIRRLDPSP